MKKILFASFITLFSLSSKGQVCFTPNDISIGSQNCNRQSTPNCMITADFNNDGKSDIALANPDLQTVQIFKGNGTGGLLTPTTLYPTGWIDPYANLTPQAIATADFNGDSKLDLAILSKYNYSGVADTIAIYIGNGSGGFTRSTIPFYATCESSVSIISLDFDGDGKSDLATISKLNNGNKIFLYKGTGLGTFIPSSSYSVGTSATYLSAIIGKDFNGDSKIDLAVTGDSYVYILFGTGSGGFSSAINFAGGGYYITSADFNNDGKIDIATSINYPSGIIKVLLGDGSGNFSYPVSFNAGYGGESIAAADFNGDGNIDIVSGGYNANISVLTGDGHGNFSFPYIFTDVAYESVCIADFNNDSKPDIAVVNDFYPLLDIFTNNSILATTTLSGTTITANPSGFSYQWIDIDNGNSAIQGATNQNYYSAINGNFRVVVTSNGCPNTSSSVNISTGITNVCFSSPTYYATGGNGANSAIAGDFNGDGKQDLIIANQGTNDITFNRGNGIGGFLSTSTYSSGGTQPESVINADFNGDGKQDLATVNYYSPSNLSILMGNGLGGFATAVSFAVGTNPSDLVSSDFNGDSKADIAVTNYGSNTVSVLLGNGLGSFSAAINFSVGTQPISIESADFNGDGKIDLIVSNHGSNNVSFLAGNGSGSFSTAVNFSTGTQPRSIIIGDFNGDTKKDIATANFGSNNISVLIGNGSGNFSAASNYPIGLNPTSIISDDYNLDGKLDLATVVSYDSVVVLVGDGLGDFYISEKYRVIHAYALASADFDGNGKPDIGVAIGPVSKASVLLSCGIPPCNGIPIGGTALSTSVSVCSKDTFHLSLSGNTVATHLFYQWQYSADNITFTDIIGATNTSYSGSQTSTTFYRCNVSCNSNAVFSSSIQILQQNPQSCFCSSGSSYGQDNDIGNVTLNTLNNGNPLPVTSNSLAVNSYTDYTSLTPTDLMLGTSYSLSISAIYSTDPSTVYNSTYEDPNSVSVFIDYDNDGIFNNLSERVFNAQTSSTNTGKTVTGIITIPNNAAISMLRMRVILNALGAANSPSCGSYFVGETEDYLVNIIPTVLCSGIPIAGITHSNRDSVCAYDNFQLSLSGNNITSGLIYQWQSSVDNISWTDISGASNLLYSGTQVVTSYYRCKISCNSNVAYSAPVRIYQKNIETCLCESFSMNREYNIGNVTLNTLNNGNPIPVLNNSTANNSFTDFTLLTPTNLAAGLSYPISISQINFWVADSCLVKVFIDYNNDAIFDPLTEMAFVSRTNSGTNGNTITGNITIPPTAALAVVPMRIVLSQVNGTNDISPCGMYYEGETEDYLVSIVPPTPCSGPPNAGITISGMDSVCVADTFQLSLSGNSILLGLSYQWQSSPDSLTWTDITGANNSQYNANQTTTTYYRCNVSCNGSTTSSIPAKIILKSLLKCYCVSYGEDYNSGNIGNVTLSTLNNGNAIPATYNSTAINTYTDYSSLQATDLMAGVSYPVSITQICRYNFSSNFNSNNVNVFIDLNGDGAFNTLTERLFVGLTTSNPGGNIVDGLINIPSTATLGNTMMRVILVDEYIDNVLPCGAFYSGETEDYLVNIIPSVPCSGNPNPEIAYTNMDSVCLIDTFQLSLSMNTIATGLTYQWQSSPDNNSWTDIIGATGITYNGTQSEETYYRCNVSCGSNITNSNSVSVKQKSHIECICVSYATNSSGSDIGNVTLHTLNNGVALPATYNSTAIMSSTNYTALTPTDLMQGALYPISVTQIDQYSFYSSALNVFIDYNNDEIFDITEKVFSGQTQAGINGNKLNGFITIPSSASPGLHAMRVILDNYGNTNSSACGSYTYGETEEYYINIILGSPCTGNPNAGNTVSSLDSVCSTESIELLLTGNSIAPGLTYQWQSSPDSVTWTNINGANAPIYSCSQSTTVYYRCKVSCGTASTNSVAIKVTVKTNFECLCSSNSQYTTEENIGNVTLNTLNNGLGTPAEYNSQTFYQYSDYTSLAPTNLMLGASYPLSITQINNYSFNQSVINVFIDYNKDGLLNPTNERVYTAQTVSGFNGNKVTGNITIPTTASMGNLLMRIILDENGSSTSSPCGEYYYGETEDYLINIIPISAGIISFNDNESSLNVSPNPTESMLTVNFSNQESTSLSIKLMSVDGKLIYSKNIQKFYGNYVETLELAGNMPGVYYLQINTDKQLFVRKVIFIKNK